MSLTLGELIEQFLRFTATVNAPSTLDYYRRILFRFRQSVGNLQIDEVKSMHLKMWARTWHQVQAVQRLFAWATADAELLEKNPMMKVKKPRAGRRKRILKARDLAKLVRKADRHFRPFLIAMRETYARPQEIRKLSWLDLKTLEEDQNLDGALAAGEAYFQLEDFKSRDKIQDPEFARVIVLSPRLCRLLLRIRQRSADVSNLIFHNRLGRPWTSNAVRLRMRSLRRRLGFGADRRGEQVVAYTLRHTGATKATAAGVRDRLLADLLGHTSTRTTARYQHPQIRHLIAAMLRAKARGGDGSE